MAPEHNARRYPRIQLPKGMLVAWQCTGESAVTRVRTIGLGGLFITTPEPPAVGSILKVLIEVPEGEVRARAVVRYVEPKAGMGIEFTNMGFEDRARLQHLLRRLMPQPPASP
jgi:hypothetical protein